MNDNLDYYYKYVNNFYFEQEKLEKNNFEGPTGFIYIDNLLKINEEKNIVITKDNYVVNDKELFREILTEICDEIINKINDEIIILEKEKNNFIFLEKDENIEKEIITINKEIEFINEINPEIKFEYHTFDNTNINLVEEEIKPIIHLEILDTNNDCNNNLNFIESVEEIKTEIRLEEDKIKDDDFIIENNIKIEKENEKEENLLIKENEEINCENKDQINYENIEKEIKLELTFHNKKDYESTIIVDEKVKLINLFDIEDEYIEVIQELKNDINILKEVKLEYLNNEEEIESKIDIPEINNNQEIKKGDSPLLEIENKFIDDNHEEIKKVDIIKEINVEYFLNEDDEKKDDEIVSLIKKSEVINPSTLLEIEDEFNEMKKEEIKNVDITKEIKLEFFSNERYIKPHIELLELNESLPTNTLIIKESNINTVIEEQIETQNIEKEITLELNKVDEILEEIIKLPNIETHADNIPIINEIPLTLNTDFENKLENIIKEIKLELSKDEINESRNDIISYDIQKEIILNIIETQNNTNNFVKEIDLIRLDNKQSINNNEFQYENIINIEEEKNIIQKVNIPSIKYLNSYVMNNENEYWKLYYNELIYKDTLNTFKIYLYINYNNEIKILPVLTNNYNQDVIKGLIEESKLYNNFTIEAFIHIKNTDSNVNKIKYKLKLVNTNDITEKLEYKFYFNSRWYEYYNKITNNQNMLQTGLKFFNNSGFYDGEKFILFEECIPMLTKINYKLLK